VPTRASPHRPTKVQESVMQPSDDLPSFAPLETDRTPTDDPKFSIEELLDEVLGLGPLEPLLKDPTVTDILVNTHKQAFVEQYGVLEPTPVQFKDERHLLRIIDRIVSAVGRRVDESQPWVDARLADGVSY
jgi:pilus assembly protein CpaF